MLTALAEEARLTARAVIEFGENLFKPTLRLGVTGLSGAGKTVLITAMVHDLIHGGRLPLFEALACGRIARVRLEPQPDDAVPRFDYERHVQDLVERRCWPESTRQVSELRLAIDYQSARGSNRTLTLDIVDYPGEWLLDLPLLTMTYADWSAQTLALSAEQPRRKLASAWQAHLATLRPDAPEHERDAVTAAGLFTEYLRACRDARYALSLLPPGRFLTPGDLEGSPAFTFAPLRLTHPGPPVKGSLWAMMERRFEAYKSIVVRPFFREHFARLDRQIVLIDTWSAFNAGPAALADLERALAAILACFRAGRWTLASALVRPRIDRILFAATKCDQLHHSGHDRIEAILARMTREAIARAKFSGALIDVVALAAVRATREAMIERGREKLPSIIGIPAAGEAAGHQIFDGRSEIAVFPGDLPEVDDLSFKPQSPLFRGLTAGDPLAADYRFLRFRPPPLERTEDGSVTLPHIRLDRALQFLLGDRLA